MLDHQLPALEEYTAPVMSASLRSTSIEVTLASLSALLLGWIVLLTVWAAHLIVVSLVPILLAGAITAISWATGLTVLHKKFSSLGS